VLTFTFRRRERYTALFLLPRPFSPPPLPFQHAVSMFADAYTSPAAATMMLMLPYHAIRAAAMLAAIRHDTLSPLFCC